MIKVVWWLFIEIPLQTDKQMDKWTMLSLESLSWLKNRFWIILTWHILQHTHILLEFQPYNDKGVSVVRKEFDSFLVFGIFIQEKKLVSYFKLMYWFSHFEFIHNISPCIILKIHRKVAMFSRKFPPAIIFS